MTRPARPTRARGATSREPAPRYPLANLEHAAGAADLHHLARLLGITHHWARVLTHTGLSDRQADHFAVRIGRHPATIWPDWWANTPDPQPRRRAS